MVAVHQRLHLKASDAGRPPGPDSDNIQLFSTGGRAQLKQLTIWQLKSAWR